MRSNFIKQGCILLLFVFSAFYVHAQYTETFESQTPNGTTFSSNGQPFTLTNSFVIFSSRAGYGYQHSNRFIDNSDNIATNQTNAIETSNGIEFTLKSLWLYVSTDGGSNPSGDGSLIITGKLNGVVQFIIIKTSGFSTSFVPNNGFTYIDFSTEGNADYSNVNIDEIDFQLQGNFNYIGIDNFTWAPQIVLPLNLLSYNATARQNGTVKLSWQTAYENNTGNFTIERSTDGKSFTEIGNVAATGNSSLKQDYAFIDNTPFKGTNYYRLNEADKDGSVKQLGIKTVTISRFSTVALFPNPVANGSFTLTSKLLANTENNYLITDISGRIFQRGIITSENQVINVSQLAPGSYAIKLSDGQVIKWIKK